MELSALNAKYEIGLNMTPVKVSLPLCHSNEWILVILRKITLILQADVVLLADEPIVNDKVGNVDLLTDISFSGDGFIAKDISKRELCDFLLSKVIFCTFLL